MNENRKQDDARLLKRLLGPAEPELSCEECFEQLDRYVELELSEADADARIPGMRAHLEGCQACDEDHRSLRALVQAETASAPPGTDAPA
jgi:anti-sigma factor RsiW